jgi:hypothetical protein
MSVPFFVARRLVSGHYQANTWPVPLTAVRPSPSLFLHMHPLKTRLPRHRSLAELIITLSNFFFPFFAVRFSSIFNYASPERSEWQQLQCYL